MRLPDNLSRRVAISLCFFILLLPKEDKESQKSPITNSSFTNMTVKKLFYFLGLLIGLGVFQALYPVGLQAQARVEGATKFGYADASASTVGIGLESTSYISSAIKLPMMSGNRIVGLSIFIAGDRKPNHGRVFVATEGDRKIALVETAELKPGWNEITLAHPLEMLPNQRYLVGYQIQARKGSKPIAFENLPGSSLQGVNYVDVGAVYTEVGDATEFLEVAGEELGNAMIWAHIEDRTNQLKQVACIISGGFESESLVAKTQAPLRLKVRNLGRETITALDLSLRYGIGDLKNLTAFSLNIAPGTTQNLNLAPLAPERGIGWAHVAITRVNAQPQLLGSDVRHFPYKVAMAHGAWPRKTVLLERFTTERCVNCPRWEEPFEEMVRQIQSEGIEVSVVAHHVGSGTDVFTIKESSDLMPYAYNQVYAPALMVNRVADVEDDLALAGKYNNRHEKYLKAKNIDEVATITEVKSIKQGGKTSLLVKGTTGYVDAEDLFLTAIVTENHLPAVNQTGVLAGQRFVHHHVARRFLTPAFGQAVVLRPDGSFEVEIEDMTLADTWQREHLNIVLFVHQKPYATDFYQRQVYTSKTISWDRATALESPLAEVLPRPRIVGGYIILDRPVDSLEVYTLEGKIVTQRLDHRLRSGSYILRLGSNGQYQAHRIIVE